MSIESQASRLEPTIYAVLRIVVGVLFLIHGTQKLFGWPPMPAGMPPLAVGSQVWIGGVIELVGGALIALGLFTRPAAFLCSGMMAVAYFQFHWKFHTADLAWLPVVNMGEAAVIYCFVFLYIAAHGAGIASLDHKRRG